MNSPIIGWIVLVVFGCLIWALFGMALLSEYKGDPVNLKQKIIFYTLIGPVMVVILFYSNLTKAIASLYEGPKDEN